MAAACVIKLGGSLLDLPDLPERIESIRSLCRSRTTCTDQLLIAGGGAVADVVRDWDRRFHLPVETSHELGIAAMQFHAELLAAILPNSQLVHSVNELPSTWSAGQLAIVAAADFLRGLRLGKSDGAEGEAAASSLASLLAASWDVTSDSIAAIIAQAISANCLILAKSRDLPAGIDIPAAEHASLVDRRFSRASTGIPRLGWINARNGSNAATSELRLHWWKNPGESAAT